MTWTPLNPKQSIAARFLPCLKGRVLREPCTCSRLVFWWVEVGLLFNNQSFGNGVQARYSASACQFAINPNERFCNTVG